jgi:hypothetical protein
MINTKYLWITASSAIIALTFIGGHVFAAAFPTSTPLYYSGQLTNTAGQPATGTKDFFIEVYNREIGGSLLCSSEIPDVDLTASRGNFRFPLPQECADAFTREGDVFVQATVDTTTLPRQKVGAVPFAVSAREAQTANLAEFATTALGVADNAVTSNALANGSVTAEKATFAPVILTRTGQIDRPRIFFGTGSITSPASSTTATGTINIAAAGFSDTPIQIFCEGAQTGNGSAASATCSPVDNLTINVTVRTPCTTVDICGGVRFNIIALGQ